IRRVAVEHLGSPADAPHDLGQRGVLEVTQTLPGLVRLQRGQEQIPQPLVPGQGLEVSHEGHRKGARTHLTLPLPQTWYNVLVKKTSNLLAQCLGAGTV